MAGNHRRLLVRLAAVATRHRLVHHGHGLVRSEGTAKAKRLGRCNADCEHKQEGQDPSDRCHATKIVLSPREWKALMPPMPVDNEPIRIAVVCPPEPQPSVNSP
jgi:hypothetical protein